MKYTSGIKFELTLSTTILSKKYHSSYFDVLHIIGYYVCVFSITPPISALIIETPYPIPIIKLLMHQLIETLLNYLNVNRVPSNISTNLTLPVHQIFVQLNSLPISRNPENQ